ncbi:CLUMA_CG002171, isoform A [Clunio marinus]|uniref:CLUMA_CG002171, isoform A n=1 Tax=Clunio marinus TaxID=568069 RepID=A0A1J1HLH4_9DIPT|nr:CLUMA_CG002171, isoform A [Clunio marinus]
MKSLLQLTEDFLYNNISHFSDVSIELEDSLENYQLENIEENMILTSDTFNKSRNDSDAFFDLNVNQNVTALVGKSAYLNCVVKNLGNRTVEYLSVSWIRHRDLHILSVSTYTFSSDLRFQTSHHRTTNEWTLLIKYVQKRDAGSYECQVSSQPIKSFFVNLNVIVPTAFILGGPEYFISTGSTINLTCIIKYSPDAPTNTFWHFKDKVLSFEREPRLSQFTENGDSFTNYLHIRDANVNDSGRYACAPVNADPDFIQVHVVNGENPEAYSSSPKLSTCFSRKFSFLSFCILILNEIINVFYERIVSSNSKS